MSPAADWNERGCSFHMKTTLDVSRFRNTVNGWINSQETNLFRNFSKLVLSGKLDAAWGYFVENAASPRRMPGVRSSNT